MLRDTGCGLLLATVTGVLYGVMLQFGPLQWGLGEDARDLLVLVGMMLSGAGFVAEFIGSRLSRRLRAGLREIDQRRCREDILLRDRAMRLNRWKSETEDSRMAA